MPVSINNTTLTFNDATTQTTSGVTSIGTGTGISSTGGKTPTLTNTGVTSVTGAGTVTVSASTGAVTITGTGGSGTVTSVATGNGLQGGTITTTGTLSVACPSFNTVGSYTIGWWFYDSNGGGSLTISSGGTVAAGGGNNQLQATTLNPSAPGNDQQNVLSGTWRNMGARVTIYQLSNPNYFGAATTSLFCRVS